MHPFLLTQPAPSATAAQQEQEQQQEQQQQENNNRRSFVVAAKASPAPPLSSAATAAANSLDIAALALTPRSEAVARAAASAAAKGGTGNEAEKPQQLLQSHGGSGGAAAAAAAAPSPPSPPPRRVRIRVESRLQSTHPAAASLGLRRQVEKQLLALLRDRSWVYSDGDVSLAGASEELLAALETCAVVDAEVEAEAPLGTVLLFWQVELKVTCYAVSCEPAAVPPSLGDDEEP